MRMCRPLFVAASACCVIVSCVSLEGLSGSDDANAPTDDSGSTAEGGRAQDSSTDQSSAVPDSARVDGSACDLAAPWGEPTPIVELNSGSDDWSPRLTSDELTIVFASARSGSPGVVSIYVATRTSRLSPFGAPVPLPGGVNSTGISVHPSITGDGLTIFYQGKLSPGASTGPDRIYRATRTNTFSTFGAGAIVPELAPSGANDYDLTPFVGSDGARVVFASTRGRSLPDFDLYEATLLPSGFTVPVRIGIVNDTPARDDTPVLTSDGLTLYFASYRFDSSRSNFDILRATRPSVTADFTDPVLVSELASPSYDGPGWVSPDGCRLYLLSNRRADAGSGALDLFVSNKPP